MDEAYGGIENQRALVLVDMKMTMQERTDWSLRIVWIDYLVMSKR